MPSLRSIHIHCVNRSLQAPQVGLIMCEPLLTHSVSGFGSVVADCLGARTWSFRFTGSRRSSVIAKNTTIAVGRMSGGTQIPIFTSSAAYRSATSPYSKTFYKGEVGGHLSFSPAKRKIERGWKRCWRMFWSQSGNPKRRKSPTLSASRAFFVVNQNTKTPAE